MEGIARRAALAALSTSVILTNSGSRTAAAQGKSIAHKWIDGWNSTDPESLVAAFTADGIYVDVPFGVKSTGSAEIRKLHKDFHDQVGGLFVKLVSSHVSDGHGTIEWTFGGKDIGVFKTGKNFEVPGVSVIDVRNGRISKNLDYYDVATIMKQVGVLPAS